MTDWIAELGEHVGVAAAYDGFDGQTIQTSAKTRVAVLRALGLDVTSSDDARGILSDMRMEAEARPIPHDAVVFAGQAAKIAVARPVEWCLEAEGTGQVLAQGDAEQAISVPPLPLGIHRLRVAVEGCDFTTWVLSRPLRAHSLADRVDPPRIWGVQAALYGLTDGQGGALGTYHLLGEYAGAIAGHGPDFVGINPVHAMGDMRPNDVISPYSPSHRQFLNTWYCGGTSLNASDLIDYPSALHRNDAALSASFDVFLQASDGAPEKHAFTKFVEDAGAPLHDFAVFEALAKRFGPDWRTWPSDYHDPESEPVARFARKHEQGVLRTKWSQWQADTQLTRAQSRATDAGMRVGLFLDMAVGPRLGGAETWGKRSALVTGATLGAPPDPLGPFGQSWGLAPLSPVKIQDDGYAGFSRLLRAAMRHAGMLRIDHILGLMRSFWIPEGEREGAYVSYPFEALLAVVAIESVRNGTIVVGEDLGLVPEGLRKALDASGIYGLDVVQFMRTSSGGFVATTQTREKAVCTFATHDTPTIAGFFAAEDARLHAGFGGIDTKTFDEIKIDRQAAAASLNSADPNTEIHSRLARSRSEIVAVQLDDIAEQTAQQNLPGTVDEYPNWRLKAPYSVRDIETSAAFARLGADMAVNDRSNPKRMEKDNDLQDCSHLAH